MRVTLDMRSVRSGDEIVEKVLARHPTYNAAEVTERTNAFVRGWNAHYVNRRKRTAWERHLVKEEEWKTRIRAVNAPLSTREPPKPNPKKRRRVKDGQ